MGVGRGDDKHKSNQMEKSVEKTIHCKGGWVVGERDIFCWGTGRHMCCTFVLFVLEAKHAPQSSLHSKKCKSSIKLKRRTLAFSLLVGWLAGLVRWLIKLKLLSLSVSSQGWHGSDSVFMPHWKVMRMQMTRMAVVVVIINFPQPSFLFNFTLKPK